MSTVVQNPVNPTPPAQTQAQTQHLLQLIWTYALGQVAQGNTTALIIPGELKSLVSQECIDELKDRYRQVALPTLHKR